MLKLVTASITLLFSGLSIADAFDSGNNPRFFNKVTGKPIITELSSLPMSGQIQDQAMVWSGSFWPSNVGGIAHRWKNPAPDTFTQKLLTKEEVAQLTKKELSQLSPAELYDISLGDYSYTLTKNVLRRYTSRDLWWEGISHGWAQASANYALPLRTVVVNPDGIKVPFSVTDVTALLSLHDAYNFKGSPYAFAGKRCKAQGHVPGEADSRSPVQNPPSAELANSSDCQDINAGAFHVILANLIGLNSKSFVMDIDRYNEVLNHPVKSYSSEQTEKLDVTSEEEARGVSTKIKMQTSVTYAASVEAGAVFTLDETRKYEYVLELDANGIITGGSWITETRPDFVWIYNKAEEFRNSPMPLAGLNHIYNASDL